MDRAVASANGRSETSRQGNQRSPKQLARAKGSKHPKLGETARLEIALESARSKWLLYSGFEGYDEKEAKSLDAIDPLLDERDILLQLHAALATDMDLIFGPKPNLGINDERGVINPPLEQLARTGYFNPDVEKGGEPPKSKAEQVARSKTEWFNLAFFKMMARYGFQPGADWPGATDPMHFELVEGVDGLLPALRPQKKEASPAEAPATTPGAGESAEPATEPAHAHPAG